MSTQLRVMDELNFEALGRTVIQTLPIGVVVFDRSLRIVEANAKATELIEPGQHIDQSLAKCTSPTGKLKIDWTAQLQKILSEGSSCDFDCVDVMSGKETRQTRIVCAAIKPTHTQTVPGGILLIEDITEKANLQKELAGAERLATIGKLASKVAHELNDPLDGILRYINLTARIVEQKQLDKPKEYLGRCREGLMRMVQIVSELLEFSRGIHASAKYVEIEQIVEDAIRAMEAKVEASNIQVFRNYAQGTTKIKSGNLFQVFCNLIKNAFDAMPDGGQLRISIHLAADNASVVEFRDTGCGFPPEHAEAIFEPFFTTKDKGSGLGLAICKDIVERYSGHISAKNAPEGGSIFTVYLPSADNL